MPSRLLTRFSELILLSICWSMRIEQMRINFQINITGISVLLEGLFNKAFNIQHITPGLINCDSRFVVLRLAPNE